MALQHPYLHIHPSIFARLKGILSDLHAIQLSILVFISLNTAKDKDPFGLMSYVLSKCRVRLFLVSRHRVLRRRSGILLRLKTVTGIRFVEVFIQHIHGKKDFNARGTQNSVS